MFHALEREDRERMQSRAALNVTRRMARRET
jgi:hypothetical protein